MPVARRPPSAVSASSAVHAGDARKPTSTLQASPWRASSRASRGTSTTQSRGGGSERYTWGWNAGGTTGFASTPWGRGETSPPERRPDGHGVPSVEGGPLELWPVHLIVIRSLTSISGRTATLPRRLNCGSGVRGGAVRPRRSTHVARRPLRWRRPSEPSPRKESTAPRMRPESQAAGNRTACTPNAPTPSALTPR